MFEHNCDFLMFIFQSLMFNVIVITDNIKFSSTNIFYFIIIFIEVSIIVIINIVANILKCY